MRKKNLTRVHLRTLESLNTRLMRLASRLDDERRPWADFTIRHLNNARQPLAALLRANQLEDAR